MLCSIGEIIRNNSSWPDHEKSEVSSAPPNSRYQQTSTKTRPDSTSVQNIDYPNFTNIETSPKSLNYRYAQSLDNSIDERILQALGSKSKSPITICWDNIHTHYKISFIKTLFTIKFLYKKFVYYKTSITSTPYICPTEGPYFFPFFSLSPTCIIPSYYFFPSPSLRYKITYRSNHNFFYLGLTRFLKIISNFFFYNYLNSIGHNQTFKKRQRRDNTYTMSKYLLFFFSCLFLDIAGSNLFFFICRSPSFSCSFFHTFFLELSCFSSFTFLFSEGLVSTVVFLLFLFFFLGALCRQLSFFFFFSFFLGALCRLLSFFFFFSFFQGDLWRQLSFFFFFSFFLGALWRQLSFFFFLSFFWGPFFLQALCRQLSFFFFLFPAWGAAFYPSFFGVEFFFFFLPFFWGPCVFSLSFHRLNKPFQIDPYVSWSLLWFTWTQFVIIPWTTCFGLKHQIIYVILPVPKYTTPDTNTWNVHRMFIHLNIEYRNPETRKTQNWFRYETLIHLFEFKGFSTWGERDTIFLCWMLLHRQLSTQPTRRTRSAQSRLASPSSESQPSSSEAGTRLTAFSQISAHASGAWRHPKTPVTIPI